MGFSQSPLGIGFDRADVIGQGSKQTQNQRLGIAGIGLSRDRRNRACGVAERAGSVVDGLETFICVRNRGLHRVLRSKYFLRGRSEILVHGPGSRGKIAGHPVGFAQNYGSLRQQTKGLLNQGRQRKLSGCLVSVDRGLRRAGRIGRIRRGAHIAVIPSRVGGHIDHGRNRHGQRAGLFCDVHEPRRIGCAELHANGDGEQIAHFGQDDVGVRHVQRPVFHGRLNIRNLGFELGLDGGQQLSLFLTVAGRGLYGVAWAVFQRILRHRHCRAGEKG